ncbi:MAG: hypothetical protein ACREU3_18100 [Steroidobacteraceae bacterium]
MMRSIGIACLALAALAVAFIIVAAFGWAWLAVGLFIVALHFSGPWTAEGKKQAELERRAKEGRRYLKSPQYAQDVAAFNAREAVTERRRALWNVIHSDNPDTERKRVAREELERLRTK